MEQLNSFVCLEDEWICDKVGTTCRYHLNDAFKVALWRIEMTLLSTQNEIDWWGTAKAFLYPALSSQCKKSWEYHAVTLTFVW